MPGLNLRFKFSTLVIKLFEMIQQALNKYAKGARQLVAGILNQFWNARTNIVDALWNDDSEFGEKAPYLIALRRASLHESLLHSVKCENGLLLDIFDGTKRMFGRPTASQIASASAKSFLFVLTYGLTKCGAIRRTVCPIASSLRDQ